MDTSGHTPALPGTSVFLIGPMGSGKTAVGRLVARQLRYRFVDSDAEIESRTGVDIPFIFEKEGEAGFRLRERDVIADLTQWPRTVVSTGGGAVLLEDNREALRSRGLVVYLYAAVQHQVDRARHGRRHPGHRLSASRLRGASRKGGSTPQVSASGRSVAGTARPTTSRIQAARLSQRPSTSGKRRPRSARSPSSATT